MIRELVEGHLDLVTIIARQVLRELRLTQQHLEDLESAGREGLVASAQRFDAARGVPFRHFANHRIRGAMLDALRRESTLPRRVHERLRGLAAALDLNEAAEISSPSPDEADLRLAEHLARLATALAVGLINEQAYDDGEPVAIEPAPSPEDLVAREKLRQTVRDAVEALPEPEKTLIIGHYYEGRRFDEISADLGLSKSWGSRLHSRAVGRLTEQLRAMR
ncbi:MAG: sigma-70 family RNA polymerase sigma factor [Myxococcales bacterium]|nr:sigma-70 family RNA polymerase sigma factor [Polyangiaceae bacterium]MDW8248487.1 sigma-70 family RNA polymerase sigma factor [Myxococcales bacterium]